MSTTATTVTLSNDVVAAIGMVGRKVTLPYDYTQYTIYSVEGSDFYAFQSDTQSITVDASMPRATWLRGPVALLLPEGAKIGEGFSREVPLAAVKVGVSLVKPWV